MSNSCSRREVGKENEKKKKTETRITPFKWSLSQSVNYYLEN